MNRIALVSFDVTNTLLKFRRAPGSAYASVASQYGVVLNEDDVTHAFKRNYKRLWVKYPNFGRGSIGCRGFWRDVVSCTLTEAGMPANDTTLLARIFNHLYDAYATDEFWVMQNSSIEVIEALKSLELKLIIVSNMDDRLVPLLRAFNLLQHFEAVVTSYESGFTKPDKRIFDCALSRIDPLKRFGGKAATHIGDDFELDYQAARTAGWNALWLNEKNTLPSKDIPPQFTLSKLCEIPSRIQRLSRRDDYDTL